MPVVHRSRSAGPLVAVATLLAALPLLSACGGEGEGDGTGGPMPSVAEFPLGADTPVARRFPLVPAQGIHVQLLPAPATPPVPGGPEPTSPSAPTTGAGAVPTFEPSVAWADGGRHLAVVTYGSSSCPSAPYGIDVVADQEIEVRLGSRFSDRDVCTADMSGFVTVVELPSGVSPTKPLTARLAGREVTIPAADG